MNNILVSCLLYFASAGTAMCSPRYSATFAADYSVFETTSDILKHGGGSLSGQRFETIQQLLAAPDKVQYLDISRCDLGNFADRYGFFSNFKNLKYLDISSCGANIDLWELLSVLPSLKELRATRNTLSIRENGRFRHGLEKLVIGGCGVSDVSSLSELTKLEEIYLMKNSVTNIAPLLQLPSIEVLEVTSNRVTELPIINHKTKLRELHISNNPIGATTNWYTNAHYIVDMPVLSKDLLSNGDIQERDQSVHTNNVSSEPPTPKP